MGYAIVLLVHSYMRWLLLALGLLSLTRALPGWASGSPFTRRDELLASVLVGAADLQLLLGLVLFLWLSPLPAAVFAVGLRAALGEPSLRFFGVLHPLAMIAGIVFLHGARVRSRRAHGDTERHRVMALGQLAWLMLVALAIPWPNLSVGRPLLRGVD